MLSKPLFKLVSLIIVSSQTVMSFSDFTLQAAPGTDFWSKPPVTRSANGPIRHVSSFHSTDFHRARVTVSADWTRLFDQGGLFIFFPDLPVGNSTTTTTTPTRRRWLKTGIEFFHEQPNLSTVSTREWSDWSLNSIDGGEVTIQVEREAVDVAKGLGSSLFVYQVKNGVKDEVPIREVTWAFEVEGEIQVGVYAARPTTTGEDDKKKLDVTFKGFIAE